MSSHKTMAAFLGILTTLTLVLGYSSGALVMKVSPYPARVYQNAPPGVTVVTVIASDNQTGRVTTLSLEKNPDANHFKIDSKGVIRTAQTIRYRSNKVFTFAVFAHQRDTTDYRQVKIIVSNRNNFPPQFTKKLYTFAVYRFGTNDVIGEVTARDDDVDFYNKHFTIYAPPRQEALNFIQVNQDGQLSLIKPVSESTAYLLVKVLAVDSGSPQLTGTTTVSVDLNEVKQPDTFCFASRATSIKLCWKNPMPGRAFKGYKVTISGGVARNDYVPMIEGHLEACYTLNSTVSGEQYIFKVMVDSVHFWYGHDYELIMNHTGVPGFHRDCMKGNFLTCSYAYPCSGNGRCLDKPDGQYMCTCDKGWQGENCTVRDLCQDSPCRYGRCQFLGHDKYRCQCRVGYIGVNCEHRNLCVTNPCGSQGRCYSQDDGNFTCMCFPGFSGNLCQERDPCSLKPCVTGHGGCQKVSDTERQCVCNTGYYGDSCEDVNHCLTQEHACLANGKCHNTSTSFYCECPPGTTGNRCQTRDFCYVEPCMNGGDCRPLGEDNFECVCPPGFYGSECQYRGPANCDGKDCNGGSCYMSLDGKFRCQCPKGFFGDLCEFVNSCEANARACNNRGKCTSKDDNIIWLQPGDVREGVSIKGKTEYTCQCQGPWFGQDCEHYNTCTSASTNLCMNGGTCVPLEKNLYKCQCPDGFYGNDCSARDPCLNNPCENGGWCSHNQGDIRCRCSPGFVGARCQIETRTCMPDMNICENNATCVLSEPIPHLPVRFLQPICICSEGFLGGHCQLERPCHRAPCVHGDCVEDPEVDKWTNTTDSLVDITAMFHCECQHDYTGSLCDSRIDQCQAVTCFNGGACEHGLCRCAPSFTGPTCQHRMPECIENETPLNKSCQCVDGMIVCSKPVCESAEDAMLTTLDGSIYCAKLPAMHLHSDMVIRCCSPESRCALYRPDCSSRTHCSESGVKDQACLYFSVGCHGNEPCEDFSQLDMSCSDLALPGDNGWVECASGKLTVLSSADPNDLDVAQVALYGKIVEDLKEAALENKTIAQLAMDSISKLASVNISVSLEVEAQNKTNQRLREFIDEYSASVPLDQSGRSDVTSDVFTVQVQSLSASKLQVDFVVDVIGGYQVPMSINVPRKILDEVKATRIQFVGFRKSQLFISPTEQDLLDSDIFEKQAVISATVTNHTLTNLTQPITIKLPKIEEGKNHTCVFWEPEESRWSTKGVVTLYDVDNGQVSCTSNHLTSFAVLLSPTPEHLPSEDGLTYITYVGCAISMACLVITLVTYGLFRCLHGEKSGKILLHLCSALLLLNAIFLAGTVDVSGYDQVGCTIVALLLHYLVLASLTWMLVEAIEMYQAIVTVFAKYERLYLIKRCIIAWGIPALIVAITAAVDINMYGSKRITGDGEIVQICFLSGGSTIAYYVSLLAPACIIIVINTVVFIMVARVILKPRFQQQMNSGSTSITPAQVRGALTVMFLLGITWVFGPLAIGKATVVFSYLFCICNSLQGCLIFVFRCLFNPEARLAWTQLVKTGTLKRRRGPIKSGYTDSSSSKAGPDTIASNRRLSNSTSTHLSTTYQVGGSSSAKTPLCNKATGSHLHPHQLHNTNGWHPNLNGWRRENGHVINNPLHTGFDVQASNSDLESNQSTPKMAKKDIVPPDSEDNFQDELTHL